jgi:hypothetical protein
MVYQSFLLIRSKNPKQELGEMLGQKRRKSSMQKAEAVGSK